jgi:4-carboxymuconolactone decarboxylase
MKNTVYFTMLLCAASCTQAAGQEASLFPKGEKGPNVHHTGAVWLNELNPADSIFQFNTAIATFAPGAKLDWHYHPGGQILLYTDGPGYYQERGQPLRVVQKGEVVKCLPGVEHWHGASPTSACVYIAISPTQKGRTVWLQPVTDAEYHQLEKPEQQDKSASAEIIQLSKKKWEWMAARNVDTLATLFHENAVFVHMGGNMGKAQELNVIKTGVIHYKHAEIQETSVQFINNTAILLHKLRLDAVVGGNEVSNPFTVTEVYVKQDGKWMLGSMSFTKLLAP